MGKPIKVRDAPGLNWREYAGGRWEARWRCREDIRDKGFKPASVRIWIGVEPTKDEWDRIADVCVSLQQEMLVYANGGPPSLEGITALDGTLRGLIRCYRTDPDSGYKKKRYASRVHYDNLFKKIDEAYGDQLLADIKGRSFLRWHETWGEGGKTTIGRANITMLRIVLNYGAAMLEDADCLRLATALSNMRFPTPKPRTERLTADQAIAIRAKAHEHKKPSVALGQAFQFECMFRQKDVIGEWVPIAEPGVTDVFRKGKLKWLRGIRWEEIDANLILRHITSKRDKPIVVDLKNAPMVCEEFNTLYPGTVRYVEVKQGDKMVIQVVADRSLLPAKGPIVVAERQGLPWNAVEYRRQWRILATACKIPTTVRNMDSRAGAITEASDAGANLEHIRHAATHSDIGMTQKYSRNSDDKIVNVQIARLEFRKRPKNET